MISRSAKTVLAASAVGLWLAAGPGWSESAHPASEQRPETTDSATSLEAEYAKLMAMARAQRKAVSDQDGEIDIAGWPALGSPSAAVAIVEFSSYQCGYCRRHFADTLPSQPNLQPPCCDVAPLHKGRLLRLRRHGSRPGRIALDEHLA
jgi:protein-disulfide isomerase